MIRIAMWSVLCIAAVIAGMPAAVAQQAPDQPASPFAGVEDELSPHPELGPRLLDDLSPEAQTVWREKLIEQTRPVMPPVPQQIKQAAYDAMAAVSPWSMRDLFNWMAWKIKAKKGLSFDEVIEAMDLKANEVNFKKTGHSMIWKDVGAITGLPTTRIEVLHYCDALVGRKMLDISPEFAVFIPCRIAVYEDPRGEIWLMTMDWDIAWIRMAVHPDSQLDEELKQDAVRVWNAMESIMRAGASGEW